MSKTISVAIIGASGYTASELIRLIHNHPYIKVKYLVGNSKAGKNIEDIYSYLKFTDLPPIQNLSSIDFNDIELVFTCLPHGETVKIINKIPKHIKIIDLSSDFRISKNDLYKEYYKENLDDKYQDEIAYGLSEIYEEEIKNKRIIACPGCYPTGALLPLIPLIKEGMISNSEIIIDAKTGISGAGRKAIENNLFCEINENLIPYNLNSHRHLAELIEQLKINKSNIQFTPQIIPVSRGIISNIYVKSDITAIKLSEFLTDYYKDSFFIRIVNEIPKLRNIIATNFCEIAIFDTNINGKKLIISNIDNLTKGSSGQAIQNFNIIYNFEINTGLTNLATYP